MEFRVKYRYKIVRLLAAILFTVSVDVWAEPYIVEASSTSFGNQIVPSFGACDLAYDTSVLTNTSGSICSGTTGSRGHYKVFAAANTTVRIVLSAHNNDGDGVIFYPVGVVFSDSTAPIAYLEENTINIDSGTSGIVEIYVGGTLTLVSKPTVSTNYNFTYEIDYSEI
jgi:hypothetical protein